MVTIDKQKKRSFLPSWFRPNDKDDKVRWFAIWLLVWNCAALADAIAFTFMPASNLDGYYGAGRWNDVTFAQTRMLANCQLGLVSLVALVGFTGNESQIRNVFRILFLTTIGALRSVYLGMEEGAILPIFDSAWATCLSTYHHLYSWDTFVLYIEH